MADDQQAKQDTAKKEGTLVSRTNHPVTIPYGTRTDRQGNVVPDSIVVAARGTTTVLLDKIDRKNLPIGIQLVLK